jgi:D-aminoacyl-tRNA deacylase
MRALLQRVSTASVEVADQRVATIGNGLLALVAAGAGDGPDEARRLARKIAAMRVFADADGRMNRSLSDVGGEILCVSQFTLYADVRRGNRPGLTGAAPAEIGRPLIDLVVSELTTLGLAVQTGRFGAEMRVALVNEGPVTIWLDTATW